MFYVRVLSSVVLVEALVDHGSVEAARDRFEQVRNLVAAEPVGHGAWAWLARAGTLLALACAEVEEARNWARNVNDGFWAGHAPPTYTSPKATGRRLWLPWTTQRPVACATRLCRRC